MSNIDLKLEAWRRETETMQPSPELMASLTALAAAAGAGAAATAAPTPAAQAGAAAGKAGVVTKIFLASILAGLIAAGARWGPDLLPKDWVKWVQQEWSLIPTDPTVVVKTQTFVLPPEPAKVAAAVKGLPATCKAQRPPLLDLVGREAARDADATGAALARLSLLCRSVDGQGAEPALWPWAVLKSKSDCDPAADTCPSGATISESIANSERCIAASPRGSCARRVARVKAVFAWCEKTIHAGPKSLADYKKLGTHLGELTQEFGASLADAAWCQNLQAQAESTRLGSPGARVAPRHP